VSGFRCVRFSCARIAALALPPALFAAAGPLLAQNPAGPPGPQWQQPTTQDKYLKVPMVNNIPGGIPTEELKNPMANDPSSADRGMQYFNTFNCIGCHAPNGGGGMGPSLSGRTFKFGNEPANHFIVIAHGAPLGMPAWAGRLPENVIWDLVSYIDSISNAPDGEWGTTVSPAANLPRIQHVPAEFNPTPRPWLAIQPFSGGDASQK
jgi:cytochrome c oxidase cbb3-type subunit III